MIELKLTFPSTDAAIEFLTRSKATGQDPAPVAAPTAPKPPKEPKPGKSVASTEPPVPTSPTATEETEPAAPAPSPESKPQSGSKDDTKVEAKPQTYEESGIAEKIARYLGKKDSANYASRRETVVALLAEFGATKGPEIKPAEYADFTAKINALLNPEDALV